MNAFDKVAQTFDETLQRIGPPPTSPTPVGHVIPRGEPIPGDVTEVDDSDKDDSDFHSHWVLSTAPEDPDTPWECLNTELRVGYARLSSRYGPLTVTAVREPEPGETQASNFLAATDKLIAERDAALAQLAIEREAELRSNAELKDIVRRLDEADVDSGGASERVGYAIQSMQRGWATATDNLARLDTVKADRETIRAALNHLKDTVTRPAIAALGVQHNEDIVPAIERLKGDLRAVDDLVQDDLMQRPAPLVLSLPSVPEGAVALIGSKTGKRWVRSTGGQAWRIEGTFETFGLASVLVHEGSVSVVMREPRTWPALPGDPEGVTAVRGNSGRIYRPTRGFWVWRTATGDEVSCDSFVSLQNYDGPLTEVFDEPGGQP